MLTSLRFGIFLLYLVLLPNATFGEERFTSAEGRFSILLPDTPQLKEIPLVEGDAPPTTQYQYSINQPDGTIIVWFQDAAHVSVPATAIKAARDTIVRMAKGPVSDEREVQLNGHPGRYVAAEIPAMSGFVRSQTFFVSGRVFQINIVGTRDFVFSQQSDDVLRSFQLTQPSNR